MIENLPVRSDLRGAKPYGAPVHDVPVRLNVNENSYDVPPAVVEALQKNIGEQLQHLNRYPDREFTRLRELLSQYLSTVLQKQGNGDLTQIPPEWVWAANGSNEVLSHIVQAFGGPGRTGLGFEPSYSMHPLITTSTGATWIKASRNADFTLDVDTAVREVHAHKPDITFICTPNNPTGCSTPLEVVEAVLQETEGIVIVDEAYAEFARSGFQTALDLLPDNPRLVVSRTMSKAFAFAGARVGYAVAHPDFIDVLRLVRLPYHLSSLTQAAACAALEHTPALLANVERLIESRNAMSQALTGLGYSVVPSDSNFLMFGNVTDPQAVFEELLAHGVLVRNNGIPRHLRVNAGTDFETQEFIRAITEVTRTHPHLQGQA